MARTVFVVKRWGINLKGVLHEMSERLDVMLTWTTPRPEGMPDVDQQS